jgi:sulfate adenylyltransferase
VTFPAARGAVRWHPPRAVLDLLRLAAAGLLEDSLALGRVSAEVLARACQGLVVEDAEGVPVAELVPADGSRGAAGVAVRPVGPGEGSGFGEASRGVLAGSLLVPVAGPLTAAEVLNARMRAGARDVDLTWLVLTGAGHGLVPPDALVRAVRTLARPGEHVLALPVPLLADRGADAAVLRNVAARLGAVDVVDLPAPRPLDAGDVHPAFAGTLPRTGGGVTVFFTGLSGSGKSTLARALTARLEEAGRTVTLLDGDEVRRLLSAGLGFTREDIAANIARIAFVAAEVTRHGGVAVCAPIAPFAEVRADARARVSATGAFVLVHVATPLAECERRDRKGLYARARAGEIADFVGIGTPYDVPEDADLTLDTTGRNVDECVDDVWALLEQRGYGTRLTTRSEEDDD